MEGNRPKRGENWGGNGEDMGGMVNMGKLKVGVCGKWDGNFGKTICATGPRRPSMAWVDTQGAYYPFNPKCTICLDSQLADT